MDLSEQALQTNLKLFFKFQFTFLIIGQKQKKYLNFVNIDWSATYVG